MYRLLKISTYAKYNTSLFSNIYLYISLIIVFLFFSCNTDNNKLEKALVLAQDNRGELEKVLNYFSKNPSDSLKYNAACFLIENMPYYHYYEGKLLDDYLNIYQELAISKKTPAAILDSFLSNYGQFSYSRLTIKFDIYEISAEYLINNIDCAFKVWEEQPWGKNVTFHDFCEFILPYRIGDEQPSAWRERMYNEYKSLLDSYRDLPEISDPLFAAKIVLDSLSKGKKYFTATFPNLPHIGAERCEQWRAGSCRELTDLTVYVLRSLGIPCGTDFMPVYARGNAGHFWAFILDEQGESYTSDYLDGEIINSNKCRHLTSKVYRQQFSVNKELEQQLSKNSLSIPDFFINPKFKDVTFLYPANNPFYDVCIPDSLLYNETSIPEIVYLCVSQKMDWIPVAWAKSDEELINFKNVKSDVIFRIGGWEKDQMVFYTDPIYISRLEGKLHPLKVKQKKENICLLSKYDINEENFTCLMVNGIFEATNDPLFNSADTLFVITRAPERLKNIVFLNPSKRYRYFRYKGPENSHCDVSEIMFHEKQSDINPLKGKVIGTKNNFKQNDKNKLSYTFDNDPYTSFHYESPSGGWAGLDFGKNISVSKITYIPRNRDNFIREGDEYQLFYLDKYWVSAGTKIAESDSLVYQDIPSNTLFFLKNHTRGNDERIFTYENGKQCWW